MDAPHLGGQDGDLNSGGWRSGPQNSKYIYNTWGLWWIVSDMVLGVWGFLGGSGGPR